MRIRLLWHIHIHIHIWDGYPQCTHTHVRFVFCDTYTEMRIHTHMRTLRYAHTFDSRTQTHISYTYEMRILHWGYASHVCMCMCMCHKRRIWHIHIWDAYPQCRSHRHTRTADVYLLYLLYTRNDYHSIYIMRIRLLCVRVPNVCRMRTHT